MKDIFQELYDQYHHDLYKFIFYMVKEKVTTEDILQEVYIKVLNSYDTYQGKSSKKTWLFSIAKHVTIDHFRKQGRRKQYSDQYFDIQESGERLRDTEPLPEEIAETNESMRQLYLALEECSEDQKMVTILRYIQDLSIRETAEILNWSTSKVKTTQHRALKQLQATMNQKEGMNDES
ncbi:RNA polymerase sigma factor SigX [Halalkalibacillus sediminis]|uniref:RNA polymerase sigma factor n=1 Tax=Halalkalibacillus sediminis TaxID=2018042 RepID=A0A2I0QX09_9BACI|nr:sigma-70 family RNA polymerase sigma factor [Halalkalibacillus sediminis]PKR78882.1 RNA polymerase sigma factor SigX [Halalkalibacillus sediminis]